MGGELEEKIIIMKNFCLYIYIYIYEYVICGLVWSLAVTFYSSHQSLYLCLPLQGVLGKRPTAGGPPCGAEGKRLLSCPHFQLLTIFSFFLESTCLCLLFYRAMTCL